MRPDRGALEEVEEQRNSLRGRPGGVRRRRRRRRRRG